MVCNRCNQPNPENTEFCLYCGEKMEKPNQTNQEIETLSIDDNKMLMDEVVNNVYQNEEILHQNITNPISDHKEENISENINIFKLLLLTIGVLIRPGTTIVEKTKKYNKTKTGLFVYFIFSTLTFLVYIATSSIKNCFIQVYNIATGSYNPTLDIGQLQYLDYTKLAIEAFLVSYGVLLILILLYYIASFLTNKGLSLGRYFVVITLSLSPFLILSIAASPIVSIFNTTFSGWLFMFGIIYSLIILLCTVNDIIIFKNTNQKIIYHSIILLIAFVIVYVLLSIFAKNLIGFL